jgi:hypothetical protein
MQRKKVLYVAFLMALGFAFRVSKLPAQVPIGSLDYCCTDLQGQACFGWGSTVGCDYGFYGGGYCACYGKWECYSMQSIPNPPQGPLCYL